MTWDVGRLETGPARETRQALLRRVVFSSQGCGGPSKAFGYSVLAANDVRRACATQPSRSALNAPCAYTDVRYAYTDVRSSEAVRRQPSRAEEMGGASPFEDGASYGGGGGGNAPGGGPETGSIPGGGPY